MIRAAVPETYAAATGKGNSIIWGHITTRVSISGGTWWQCHWVEWTPLYFETRGHSVRAKRLWDPLMKSTCPPWRSEGTISAYCIKPSLSADTALQKTRATDAAHRDGCSSQSIEECTVYEDKYYTLRAMVYVWHKRKCCIWAFVRTLRIAGPRTLDMWQSKRWLAWC